MARHIRALAMLGSLGVGLGHAPAAAAEQEDLKAAIVFNIIRFTRFAGVSHGDVVLCVAGPRALLKAFAQVDGRPVPDGRLAVRVVHEADTRSGCTISFIANGTSAPGADGPSMTIGDSPGFTARGGTVGLRQFGRQISFDVNTRVGERQGVRFSARLLSLAVEVRSR
jgi:hypothetical protein